MCDGLTVSFDIRYLDGAEGDRIAVAQADAIAALLNWLAHRDSTQNRASPISTVEGVEKDRAA